MHKKIKKSIFFIFMMTMMLFLYACDNELKNEDLLEYKVNFLTEGGSDINSLTFNAGDEIILPNPPTKLGHEFIGWGQVPKLMPKHDIYLYASWKVLTYEIIIDTDGGNIIDNILVDYNSVIDLNIIPQKLGYEFLGWDQEIPNKMPANNLNIKALWGDITYTIIFDTDGGSIIEDLTYHKDADIIKPQDPIKPGYKFIGWDQQIPHKMPGNDLNIKALWQLIENQTETIYTENFEGLQALKDNGENFSSYEDFFYHGTNEVVWDVTNGRIDIGMKLGGNAITIGGYGNEITQAGMGRIYVPLLSDGIKYLSFDARLPFSPKSTYPQVNGNDKAINVKIKVFINNELITTLQFKDDTEANKGKTFILENLNIEGDFSLSIEISSGHRLTLDNITWQTNKYPNQEEIIEPIKLDFESDRFDYDTDEVFQLYGNIEYIVKEVHTLIMHQQKELNYMNSDVNGNVVARFRGNKTDYPSTPTAYIYNVDPFDYVGKLVFDARLFGSETFFNYDSKINIYYKTNNLDDWTLVETNFNLKTEFNTFETEINKENLHIKIEVVNGTVNIDNIIYHQL
ncbi:InlB B-repeat-containing protein [Acholeplasma granularum]|uniref:InlB B-repeat-containing protein n=1 Tax=Acholeplasma granularum TaxID=264635 RepID=UPI000472AD66|nr:InlB B-repeat-containing protein [Acholeplasma granularum]